MLSKIITNFFILMVLSSWSFAHETDGESQIVYDFWKCTNPINGFWGLNNYMKPMGLEFGFGIITTYQANAKGGISTNGRRGRHVGRYDLNVSFDLKKLLRIEAGSFFIHGWGGWPDTECIDGHSVGSVWGMNALTVGNRGMDVVEAFYEGPFLCESIIIAAGKLDFTGIFDISEYADDECGQFFNASLVDNPAIPFPEQGLGIVLNWAITDNWYLMGGVTDALADSRETGLNTALHKEDYFFYALETGIAIGKGNYRVGLWNGSLANANSDGSLNCRDEIGFYTSCDWLVYEEDPKAEDGQGLGMFARYGYVPSRRNDITNYFSAGLQYLGLFDCRDDDIFGLGYAHGILSNSASATYHEDYEIASEVFYNAQITPWLTIGPNVQYLVNPGGSNSTTNALVVGLRTQLIF